jgi:hypothetical protein
MTENLKRPNYLHVLGWLGIIASILLGIFYSDAWRHKQAIEHVFGNKTEFSETDVFLIDTVIRGFVIIGILLSVCLLGLGSILKSKKTA